MINADKRFMFCFSYLELFSVVSYASGRVYSIFTPVFPGNLLSPLSLLFHFFPIYSPLWKRPFHYRRRVIAWTGKLNYPRVNPSKKTTTLRAVISPGRTLRSVASGLEKPLLAGYLKTVLWSVLCQSLSLLTNLVPRPTQILLAFWSADFPGIYENLNVREVKFPSRFQVHYRP